VAYRAWQGGNLASSPMTTNFARSGFAVIRFAVAIAMGLSLSSFEEAARRSAEIS
jgi:hypothetical protein